MTEQGKSGLDTNEETLDAKGLEHNLRNLLSVLRRVHWWLGQNEPMFLWFTSQVRVHGLVPKLLNAFPIFDLS